MRAVIITAPGGPEVLEIREVDPPEKPAGRLESNATFGKIIMTFR